MYDVAVIMSTYNGSRFIKEQLDSILGQKSVTVTIFVRDDGSDDDTVEIIKRDYPQVVLDEGENIGVGNSFMECLYKAGTKFDYYCFSDQDDVWLEDKLISAINMLDGEEHPVLYSSNQSIIDSQGALIGTRYQKEPEHTYSRSICSNRLAGCTFVWNRSLQEILIDPKRRPDSRYLEIRIHDVWLVLVANIAGRIVYDGNPHIRYRIHEKNYVGVSENHGIAGKIKAICSNIKSGKMTYRSSTCAEILARFEDLMTKEDLENTKEHCNYMNDIKLKARLLTNKTPYFLADNESLFSYRVKLLLNLW